MKRLLRAFGLVLGVSAPVLAGPVSPPAGSFVQITNSLQSGSTYYVSSGTVINLQAKTLKFFDGTSQTTAGTVNGVTAGLGLQGGGTSGNIIVNLSSSATNYVQNTSTLQSGATFYVSSGSVATSFLLPYATPSQCLQTDATGKVISSGGACGGGGGGGSSLAIISGGVIVSSPTAVINVDTITLVTTFVAASTATIGINQKETIPFNSITASTITVSTMSLSFAMLEGAGTNAGKPLLQHNLQSTFLGSNTGNATLLAQASGDNTIIGANSVITPTSGANNTVVGFDSLNTGNTSVGNNNVIVGDLDMNSNTGNANTVMGSNANNSGGAEYRNVVMGFDSAFSATSISSSVFIGAQSGYGTDLSSAVTTGVSNVFIGYEAGVSTSATINNSIAIGYGATVVSSNSAQIGGAANTSTAINVTAASMTTTAATITGVGAGQIGLTEGTTTSLTLIAAGTDVLYADNGTHLLTEIANNTSTATLVVSSAPVTVGQCAYWTATGQVGSTACGSGGSGNPGGSNRDVQFNNAGVLGGDTNFIVTPTSMTYQNRSVFNYQPGDDLSIDSSVDSMIVMMRSTSDRLKLQMTGVGNDARLEFADPSGYPRDFDLDYQGASGTDFFLNNIAHDVSVRAPAISNSQRILFGVGNSSATIMIDSNTHVNFEGNNTPTVSACGTTPSISAISRDNAGTITVGSGVTTSCTLTFRNQFLNPPVCIASDNSTAVTSDISAVSKTAVTFSFSASLGSGQIYYICIGND